MGTRVERDSMGSVEIPEDAWWGAQTQRCLEHFDVGPQRLPDVFWHAYLRLKRAAAGANAAVGELSPERARWIADAVGEALEDDVASQFPLGVWQSGSGTPTNMNVNEVLARRANRLAGLAGAGSEDPPPVHPNDHVNRGQSTNDTFPTVMHLSAALELRDSLLPALETLRDTLEAKAREHADLVKIGRTHLQDATPLTLGQEIGGWAALLAEGTAALRAVEPRLHELALGGTAVGTGLNAHPRFAAEVVERLARETGLPLRVAPDPFAALSGQTALAGLSGALSVVAGALFKVANDVRWLASGPRCGLGELSIPANEPGSSIMPGKVNPSQSEALIMACLRVLGNHTTVSVAATQGNFQLNVCRPVVAHAVLESIDVLAGGARSFERHCARGLRANEAAITRHVERSLMLVTALAPHIGYAAAAGIAERAHREETSLREAALASGLVDADQFDAWVDARAMLGPRASDEDPS